MNFGQKARLKTAAVAVWRFLDFFNFVVAKSTGLSFRVGSEACFAYVYLYFKIKFLGMNAESTERFAYICQSVESLGSDLFGWEKGLDFQVLRFLNES